jgi:calcineurin-like phosphoesterase
MHPAALVDRRAAEGLRSRAVIILFIGDVVGEPGRRAVRELLPRLRGEHGVDVVIANGENAAGGSGITVAMANELFAPAWIS